MDSNPRGHESSLAHTMSDIELRYGTNQKPLHDGGSAGVRALEITPSGGIPVTTFTLGNTDGVDGMGIARNEA